MKKRYAALIFCAIGLLLGSITSREFDTLKSKKVL